MEGPVKESGLDTHAIVHRGEDFTLDVSLRVEPGRTVALLGPNGAGKSTAVAAIAGLVPLDRGHIALAGATLDDTDGEVFVPPEERRIGVMFQDYALFPHLTVSENIAFGLRDRRSVARRKAAEWMTRLDLERLGDRKPADLSGGQAQRVALARALIIEPDLLLLDEPLSALDVTARVRLRRRLAEHLAQFPGPRLLITHDPTEAFLLSNEIHVIEDGAVTQVGTADDIRLRPRTPYAADLAGANLVVGTASQGIVTTDGHQLHVADTHTAGPVLATIHPRAISLHRQRPEGSPRNTWSTTVALIENLGERIRLNVADPLPLTVEVTPDAVGALDLRVGSAVWVSIKATEISVETD
ncbi:MAG: sulfate/molybdate ABC transporter ATP-binding protein [Acidimicrobiia bacterium]